MLLKLEKLIAKYGMKITGVIQAGANEGQELELFKSIGITKGYLFEPCKEAFNKLKQVMPDGFHAINFALSHDADALTFSKTLFNNGQSNSALKPKKHLDYYPNIVFDSTEKYLALPLDFYEIKDCNLLVMDVQGFELNVLKGANMISRFKTIQYIDYIITEVNIEEIYEGCALIEDLDNYLTDFERVETKLARCKAWGDALYIRKTLL